MLLGMRSVDESQRQAHLLLAVLAYNLFHVFEQAQGWFHQGRHVIQVIAKQCKSVLAMLRNVLNVCYVTTISVLTLSRYTLLREVVRDSLLGARNTSVQVNCGFSRQAAVDVSTPCNKQFGRTSEESKVGEGTLDGRGVSVPGASSSSFTGCFS